jgi:hypothetical protein
VGTLSQVETVVHVIQVLPKPCVAGSIPAGGTHVFPGHSPTPAIIGGIIIVGFVALAAFWPHPIEPRAVEPVGPRVHLVGVEMAVKIHRYADRGVPQDPLHHLGRRTRRDVQGGGRVPQAVNREPGQASGTYGRIPEPPTKLPNRSGPPFGAVKTSASASRPSTRPCNSSTSERGNATLRLWWDFGTPSTRAALSDLWILRPLAKLSAFRMSLTGLSIFALADFTILCLAVFDPGAIGG